MKRMIFHAGLRFSTECINLFAKWLLHSGHLDREEEDELTIFSAIEDQRSQR